MAEFDDEPRWWPRTPRGDGFVPLPHRSASMVYSSLGPIVTHLLVEVLRNADSDDPTVERLLWDLEQVDGRAPDMLVLLGTAMGAVQREFDGGWNAQVQAEESSSQIPRSPHLTETYKHLGSLVFEAMEAFGFTEETFAEYLRDQWESIGNSEWPPTGAAYTEREPEGPGTTRAERRDPWTGFCMDRFGRMSMITSNLGMHQSLDDLSEYVSRLDEAMQFADVDVDSWYHGPSSEDRAEIIGQLAGYVAEVRRLQDELRSLGVVIDSVFPT